MKEGARRAGWEDLIRELDAWQAEGLMATLWWRDDDAAGVTDALGHMLEISENTQTPLALSVIPARADTELRDLLADKRGVTVLHHGYAHINHQPEGSKKSEFGSARDARQVEVEINLGREIFSKWQSYLPVFVPPWNRMDHRFLEILVKCGIIAVSEFKARPERNPVPDIVRVNSHVDLIQSRDGSRQFIGIGAALQAIIDHLSSRRRGRVDRTEPTGILTHHLDHRDDCWKFLEQALRSVENHPAARWLSAREVFETESI